MRAAKVHCIVFLVELALFAIAAHLLLPKKSSGMWLFVAHPADRQFWERELPERIRPTVDCPTWEVI